MDKVVAKAKETGKFDYDAPVEGMTVVDKYTLKLKLIDPWWDLVADLTSSATAAVAREVVEAYGDGERLGDGESRRHRPLSPEGVAARPAHPARGEPVLPRRALSRKQRSRRQGDHGEAQGAQAAADRARSTSRSSRRRTRACSRSSSGQLDYIEVPVDLVANVLEPDNKLKPRFAKAGVALQRGIQPSITYTWFNMEDPVVGGYTTEKIALRRAIGMAYNVDEEAQVIRQGQAEWASQLVPPGVTGHDPKFVGNTKYDPVARQGAARQVRLRRSRQGRLARSSRRQAARAAEGERRPPRSSASTTSCGSAT